MEEGLPNETGEFSEDAELIEKNWYIILLIIILFKLNLNLFNFFFLFYNYYIFNFIHILLAKLIFSANS